jgi:hypothetical protein
MPRRRVTERDALNIMHQRVLETFKTAKVGEDGHMADLDGFQVIHETQKDRLDSTSKFAGLEKTPESFSRCPPWRMRSTLSIKTTKTTTKLLIATTSV